MKVRCCPVAIAAALSLGLLAGCGRNAADEDQGPAESANATARVEPGPSGAESEARPAPAWSVRTELQPVNSTDVTGTVTLSRVGDQLHVDGAIHSANDGYPYVVELRRGVCQGASDPLATVVEFTAGPGGDAEIHGRVEGRRVGDDTAGLVVQVRGAGEGEPTVACGTPGSRGAGAD